MDKCKYCGSSELELENKTKFNIMDAPQVALKCAKCGKWLKWCPKDERKYYLGEFKKIAQKSNEIQIEELQKQLFNKEKDLELIASSNSGLSRMVTERNRQIEILDKALALACEAVSITKIITNEYIDTFFIEHKDATLSDYFKIKAQEIMKSEQTRFREYDI